MATSTVGLDGEEEPRRGASRANSVRFDESAIHGYYGQANRSSTELPLRTSSGMGGHPLTEPSLSHRSDGRHSSSGFSHHSARTNSLGLDTSSRLMGSSVSASPLTPPPGLFLLGPVPCIIRCWMTTNFSNESLLYAAVCSGSYVSSLGTSMITKLGLEDSVMHEEDRPYIKLPLYLPEASVHQASSRSASPEPQLPSLKIRFLVRETDPTDDSIQIILGSDVLRAHNADILFSSDKITMSDDERNRINIPLVRPEKDSVFKLLCTVPDIPHPGLQSTHTNGQHPAGVIGQPAPVPLQSTSAPASTRVSIGEADESEKPCLSGSGDSPVSVSTSSTPATATDTQSTSAKSEGAGVWGSWRREAKPEVTAANNKSTRGRPMKVLRPTKPTTRVGSSATTPTSATAEHGETHSTNHSETAPTSAHPTARSFFDDSRASKASAPNPIGGASAFGWLNPSSSATRATRQP